MSYIIETRSVSEFVVDNDIKLPRFQRKSTWTAKQNFELAISIFQEYPVGVVIINEERGTQWLLDGRQRRTALMELRANPDSVYEWAKKYIKFKPNEDINSLRNAFWGTVDAYLQADNEDDDEPDSEYINDENQEDDINKSRQKEGLTTLLDIILMVHQKKSGLGLWERIFSLKDYVNRLPYAPKRENYTINPVSLRSFLLDYSSQNKNFSIDSFIQFLDDRGEVKDEKFNELKNLIERQWNEISSIISTISKSEQIFKAARIGVILIKNVTPLDAQNIFSRINSGGTQLKAEELLSAKPFWNEKVINHDSKMVELVKQLYDKLGVETPTDGTVVRWDYGATLIARIKDKGLLFDIDKDAKKEIDMGIITLGFKLISSYFEKGMSAVVVGEIERDNKIKWGQSIDELVDNINKICEILHNNDFFKFLSYWKKSIYHLMGSAIILEFITILLLDWESRECPTTASSEMNGFLRDAKNLFDRLVFEYAIGAWRGSGDSKMAAHIKNWDDRVKPLESSRWKDLLDAVPTANYHGQNLDIKHLTPILCYQYALQKIIPYETLEETSEVDHIIPQAKLSDNPAIPQTYKDALFNLVLLPKPDNNQKKDKYLKDIPKSSLRESYAKYSGISVINFEKYSDVANMEALKEERMKMLKQIFGELRSKELAN